jgi:hypothetical protein
MHRAPFDGRRRAIVDRQSNKRAVVMGDLVDDILALLKIPVAGNLDVKHLFLLIGLTLVMVTAWIMILSHIRAAVEEI